MAPALLTRIRCLRWLRGLRLAALGLASLSCATPALRFDREAERLGFVRSTVPGTVYRHAIYASQRGEASGPLHVYLGGDGPPARASRYRPPDPTPLDPIALELMAEDPAPGIYLGRPCYHGVPCDDPVAWSLGRYDETVVESLAGALARVRAPDRPVVLIGFSGGGTLAMLLAERVPGTRAVVTVAGNLDPDAWALHHGFTTLHGSNPSRRPPLPADIVQLHLLAGRDTQVPPALVRGPIQKQPGACTWLFPELDHRGQPGGWTAVWPRVLAELERLLSAPRTPCERRP